MISDGTSRIPLWRGDTIVGQAHIDNDDLDLIEGERWSMNGDGYAVRSRDGMAMHRLLLGLGPGDGTIVDHRNRKRIDNRRANLRIVSPEENTANRGSTASIGGAGKTIRDLRIRIAQLEAERDFYFRRAYDNNEVLRRVA